MPDLANLNDNPTRMLTALVLALIVSLLAWRLHALTFDGAIAATIIGAFIVSGGDWWSGLLLIAFFVTGSLLSKIGRNRSTSIRQQRGSQRDAVQVLANGGVPALLFLLAWFIDWHLLIIAAISAIAAATADTWATEIGRISQAAPRSITTWQTVPPGTSGAVSTPGTIATVLGSCLIAAIAAIGAANGWIDTSAGAATLFLIISIAGIAGSLLDSLLGATVQQSFTCQTCGVISESPQHASGHSSIRTGGIPGVSNDLVNLLALMAAAIIGLLFTITLQ